MLGMPPYYFPVKSLHLLICYRPHYNVYPRSNDRILIKNREYQAKQVGFTYFGIYRHDSVKLHFYDVNLLFHHTPKGLC